MARRVNWRAERHSLATGAYSAESEGAMEREYEILVEELDEQTCWLLLARAGFGRVGFVQDEAVLVLPVNCAVREQRVIFRTGAGTSLAAAGDGSVVAFEADHTDRVAESGWSVLARGRLWDVTDRPETATWSAVLVRPWAPGTRDRWMMIEPTQVTGRMIQRHRNLPSGVRASSGPPS
jgi:nitroimidazol reductase NimA-like FMN-containing flavoprotein (pyridoxamine 5'-phosphate oxidase superfamily)